MKSFKLILLIIFLISLSSCSKDENNFIATDLFVRIDSTKNINEVFNFINSYDHEVEYIMMQAFTSSLPADSLNNALDYLVFLK